MNIDRLTKIAEWLEAGAKHERITFDMSTGIMLREAIGFDATLAPNCAAACCIAGAAVQFFGDVASLASTTIQTEGALDAYDELLFSYVADEAATLLDLSYAKAGRLFEPHVCDGPYRNLVSYNDPQWAARTIRWLINTGEVDWAATKHD